MHTLQESDWGWPALFRVVLVVLLVDLAFNEAPIPAAHAATRTVCASGCDYTTIQAAINAADPGDTISISAGSYSGNVIISKALTLQGAGASLTVISGGAPVITVNSSVVASIDGVAISGGDYTKPPGGLYTGGGGLYNAGVLTLSNSLVTGNRATGGNNPISGYDRSGYGGGIFNFCGTLTLNNSTVSGNRAAGSNDDRQIAGGEAEGGVGYGGGIFNLNASLTVISSTVSNNEAAGGAGLGGNGAIGRGGPGRGGGIFNFAWSGGGCSAGASLTLFGSTVSHNEARGSTGVGGGPAGNGLGGYGSGGAIYNATDTGASTSIGLTNSTVSYNTATGGNGCDGPDPSGGLAFGGGISSNSLSLLNSTIAYNKAVGGSALGPNCSGGIPAGHGSGFGGGLEHGGAIFYQRAQNTIVAHNNPTDCLFPITSYGHNLESGTSCGFTSAGDLQGSVPALAGLQTYGGPTFTHGLHIGSPAIDAGDNAACPATDQRGQARPLNGICDIGAFEGAVPYTLFLPVMQKQQN
jgi:hypothetical protein